MIPQWTGRGRQSRLKLCPESYSRMEVVGWRAVTTLTVQTRTVRSTERALLRDNKTISFPSPSHPSFFHSGRPTARDSSCPPPLHPIKSLRWFPRHRYIDFDAGPDSPTPHPLCAIPGHRPLIAHNDQRELCTCPSHIKPTCILDKAHIVVHVRTHAREDDNVALAALKGVDRVAGCVAMFDTLVVRVPCNTLTVCATTSVPLNCPCTSCYPQHFPQTSSSYCCL